MRGLLYLALGTIAFIAITLFEQLPVLGWAGGAISIAAWIWLTRALLSDSEFDVIRSGKVKVEVRHTYPLSEAAAVHRDLEGRGTAGKLLLIPR